MNKYDMKKCIPKYWGFSLLVAAMFLLTMFIGTSSNVSASEYLGTDYESLEYERFPNIAHWKFDEISGPTAYNSITGSPSGYITGCDVYEDGVKATGYSFDGSDDNVAVAHDDDIDFTSGEDFAIFAWIKTGAEDWGRIVEKRSTDASAIGYYMTVTGDGNLQVGLDFGATSQGVVGTYVADNVWHHVGFVRWSNNVIEAFIDGESVGTPVSAAGSIANNNYLYIGTDRSNGWFDYTGYIDDVQIYDYGFYPYAIRSAHWKLDESSGNAADSGVGTPYDGTVTGASQGQDGKEGNSYYFYSNDRISIASHGDIDFTIGEDFSIFAWIKTSYQGYEYILDKRYYGGGICDGYLLAVWNTGLVRASLYAYNSGSSLTAYSTSTVNDGEWHHVGMVRKGVYLKIYVDGVEEANVYGAAGNIHCDPGLKIGSNWGGAFGFRGNIDDVEYFNYATKPRLVDSLVAHWKFDETSGTTAYDSGTQYGSQDATNSGATINQPGKVGSKAYAFDGSNDRVYESNTACLNFKGSQDFSIYAWTKTSVDDEQMSVVSKQQDGGTFIGYEFGITKVYDSGQYYYGRPFIALDFGSNAYAIYGPDNIADGAWHHIGFVREGATISLYVDGICVKSSTDSVYSGSLYNTGPLEIGCVYSGRDGYGIEHYGHWFDGYIDDVRIYSEAIIPQN